MIGVCVVCVYVNAYVTMVQSDTGCHGDNHLNRLSSLHYYKLVVLPRVYVSLISADFSLYSSLRLATGQVMSAIHIASGRRLLAVNWINPPVDGGANQGQTSEGPCGTSLQSALFVLRDKWRWRMFRRSCPMHYEWCKYTNNYSQHADCRSVKAPRATLRE